jgi:cytochrome b
MADGNATTSGIEPGTPAVDEIDLATRLIHLALVVGGIAALVSGQFAGDYRKPEHTGFSIHQWCGIVMAVAVGVRWLWGFAGPRAQRFSSWFPVTRGRLAAAWQDIIALARFTLPARPQHQGLAGPVQAAGLCAFAWMAVTGALLFVWLEPGARAAGGVRLVKELHEGAQVVLWTYLALHVGAVILHALTGHDLWRRMFFLGGPRGGRQ